MTLWQELAALWGSGTNGGDSSYEDPWASAPAPTKVGKRVLEALFDRDVPASSIPLLTNVIHWSYGVGCVGVYGVLRRGSGRKPLRRGVAFGAGVCTASYAELVPICVYEPPWRYPAKTLAFNVSYHLVHGAGAAARTRPLIDDGRRSRVCEAARRP
jgi:hypothetical protein